MELKIVPRCLINKISRYKIDSGFDYHIVCNKLKMSSVTELIPSYRHVLETFITQLLDAGLLRPSQTPTEPVSVEPWLAEDLHIQEFTDMADLLGLDPIHDADAALGWPSKPQPE